MKKREFAAYVRTNNQGRLQITGKDEMDDFLQKWPNQNFIFTLEVAGTGASQPLIAYYYKKIVPDMQRAFFHVEGLRLTPAQTDQKLREMSPITIKQTHDGEKWNTEILDIRQLDNQQLVFFIEHIKEVAAEEYGTFIDDPQTILK